MFDEVSEIRQCVGNVFSVKKKKQQQPQPQPQQHLKGVCLKIRCMKFPMHQFLKGTHSLGFLHVFPFNFMFHGKTDQVAKVQKPLLLIAEDVDGEVSKKKHGWFVRCPLFLGRVFWGGSKFHAKSVVNFCKGLSPKNKSA